MGPSAIPRDSLFQMQRSSLVSILSISLELMMDMIYKNIVQVDMKSFALIIHEMVRLQTVFVRKHFHKLQ